MDTYISAATRQRLVIYGQQQYRIRDLVEEFIDYMHSSGEYAESTIPTRTTHLRQFASFCNEAQVIEPSELTFQTLNIYISHYLETHSASTTKTAKRIIKVFIWWIQYQKEIQCGLKYEQIKTRRHKDNTPKSINHCPLLILIRSIEDESDRLAVRTMYEAGLRISEVTHLTLSDVHDGAIFVRGKGAKKRTVYISRELAIDLRRLGNKYSSRAVGYIFNYRGKRLREKTLRDRLHRYSRKALGMEINPHPIRHSYAVRLLENGCDIVTIQDQMGHESIETTRQYLRLRDDFKQMQHAKYGFSTA